MKPNWNGVIPAITTKFNPDGSLDLEFFARHCAWMIDAGCIGLVPCGSLGESATLSFDEKVTLMKTAVQAVGDRAAIIPGIAALSTDEAVRLAKAAHAAGCAGLMVLPPYVYSSDWREMKAHVSAVISATPLACMLYNNPPAYKTDFTPEQIAELAAEHANLVAVKESSTDVRRVTAIRALLNERLKILCGVDDAIVEAIQAGAVGWIAGLVNAYPSESVELFNLAVKLRDGDATVSDRLNSLYRWFLPLLRLDTVPKFVQLIKLCQQEVGMGSEVVRAPRMVVTGKEREETLRIIKQAGAPAKC
jgi:4-hydroxy-tetrahydrodipicolinate synthase